MLGNFSKYAIMQKKQTNFKTAHIRDFELKSLMIIVLSVAKICQTPASSMITREIFFILILTSFTNFLHCISKYLKDYLLVYIIFLHLTRTVDFKILQNISATDRRIYDFIYKPIK